MGFFLLITTGIMLFLPPKYQPFHHTLLHQTFMGLYRIGYLLLLTFLFWCLWQNFSYWFQNRLFLSFYFNSYTKCFQAWYLYGKYAFREYRQEYWAIDKLWNEFRFQKGLWISSDLGVPHNPSPNDIGFYFFTNTCSGT